MTNIQLIETLAAQAMKVNAAYDVTGGINPAYELEFDILCEMRAEAQAEQYRLERGLPQDAKTPYDR